MEIINCKIEGLKIIKPKVFNDERGYFFELWNDKVFHDNANIIVDFVQDNLSRSQKEVIRGLHFQYPFWQDKLVSVLEGEVIDYAIDIRKDSSTFGKWESVCLSRDNAWQFFIPKGFAHGFEVLSEYAILHYKCSDYYEPKQDYSLQWNDKELNIDWKTDYPKLSEKDSKAMTLEEVRKLIND